MIGEVRDGSVAEEIGLFERHGVGEESRELILIGETCLEEADGLG